ncbi:MAG: pseudoazurin [Pseudohongiellaceae bacterium]
MQKLFTVIVFSLVANVAFAAEHVVEMKNMGADGSMVFEPAVVNAEVGDTIRFVATDMAHNSVSADGLVPAGANTWQGQMNEEVTVTLNEEGVYVYQCTPHLALGMVGVIVAGEPTNLEQIRANIDTLSSRVMVNKERIEQYLGEVES